MNASTFCDSPEVLARVREGLSVVDAIARQKSRQLGRSIDFEELVSFGREGLLAAARSFDASRGVPFRSWAILRVRGAMLDGVRRQGALPRRAFNRLRRLEAEQQAAESREVEPAGEGSPADHDRRLTVYLLRMATALTVRVVTPSGAEREVPSEEPSPEEAYARAELSLAIHRAIGALPKNERVLVERYYFGGLSLEEAGAELGLSKSWASRLHARAIAQVADTLRKTVIAE
jgi:RNA polymerase sigma factor for flagellar operon FliA